MINVGEQLVSSYLRYILGCDFIETSIPIKPQGDIDVIGLNHEEERVYVCEVSISLTSGIQRTTSHGIETVKKHTEKFSRAIDYTRKHLYQYEHHFMLWSPIVTDTKGKPENNQLRHLKEIQANIKTQYGVEIECIVNEQFQKCIMELRSDAKAEKTQLQCPLMRFMQIEEHLNRYISMPQRGSKD